ncbi:MAG: hypothetical protein EOP84_19575, partial [Verrucomicrobiaceae bacterium]
AHRNTAVALQAMLGAIGVKIDIQMIEGGTMWETTKAGNYEIQQKERFRSESSQLAERLSNLERQRFKLFNHLQLEEGPRALKLVLPVARIVRRFAGTKAPPA